MNRRDFLKLTPATILSIPLLGEVEVNDFDFWQAVKDTAKSFDVRYRGIPIEEYPLKPNEINISIDLNSLFIAQAWGIVPSEFDKLSIEDRIRISAWYIVKHQIQAVMLAEEQKRLGGKLVGFHCEFGKRVFR